MNRMLKMALMAGGGGAGLLLLVGGATAVWATQAAATRQAQSFSAHDVDIPVPYPLSEEDIEALRAERSAAVVAEADDDPEAAEEPGDVLEGVDLEAIALERALERGRHLVEARYACVDCHGATFGGGMMLDDAMVGTLMGPNLTGGKGSATADYTMGDWDRIVRHGIKPDGHPTVMPSTDFLSMSDQELSDIVAYIGSLPPVDKEMPGIELGPLGTLLIATGTVRMTAEEITDHQAAHKAFPPSPEDGLAFGTHLAQVCNGCHGQDFSGGVIPGAPPDWPAASNLTPGGALADYDWEQFEATMRRGVKPSGEALKPPMSLTVPLAQNMTDEELRAIFEFLRSLPPVGSDA